MTLSDEEVLAGAILMENAARYIQQLEARIAELERRVTEEVHAYHVLEEATDDWVKDVESRVIAAERRTAGLESALRDIGQTASDDATAMATWVQDEMEGLFSAMGRFESIAIMAWDALQEDQHDG